MLQWSYETVVSADGVLSWDWVVRFVLPAEQPEEPRDNKEGTAMTERYVVRRTVDGGWWYVLDTDPKTYSRIAGTRNYIPDTHIVCNRNKKGDYLFRTYQGAKNFAAKLAAQS